ncbi:MAG: FeoA family protein [Herbinix sp.]|jgi:ferrous iron transport protein A|nr:FeoA family protein [Herbinix sp.]
MDHLIPLSKLPVGSSSKIKELCSTGSMRRRLLDLGFAQGTAVSCVQTAPSGDPIAYSVKGAVIALRKEDAEDILVRTEDSTGGFKGSDFIS